MMRDSEFLRGAERGAEWLEQRAHAEAADGPLGDDRGDDEGYDPTVNDVALIRGDTVRMRPVRWIWDGWLAAGKFHVLAGQPGVGKSTIALALAATITRGGRWPDGSIAPVGNVVIWSGEDDPSDTLAPRLQASAADLSRVFFVGDAREGRDWVPFDPARHMQTLQQRAGQTGNIRLVIVDPIVSAVMGDSHKNAEVRRSLQPLVDLAARLDCAVLGISHFTKGTSGRDPVERVTGSLAFGALARVVLAAAKLPPDDDGLAKRILARAKSNIGVDYGGFGFDLEQAAVESVPGLYASRVLWGEAIDGTARELLAEADGDDDGDGRSAVGDAAEFLQDELAAGAVPVNELFKRGKAAGVTERTLRRAKTLVGASTRKNDYRGGWEWYLPATAAPKMAKIPEDAQQKGLASFGNVGHLGDDSDVVEVEF